MHTKNSDDDLCDHRRITPELELAIMHFWATVVHMERSFSPQEISAIPALSHAIRAVHMLPAAIGWQGVTPDPFADSHKVLRFTRTHSDLV